MVISPAEIAHGPMLIGTALNIFLYGVASAQLYLYYTSNAIRDNRWIRGLVYLLFLGDTIHTLFTVIYMYDSLVEHFGDVPYLMTGNWIFATDPALTGIIGGLVQAFFAWRVRVLTRNMFLTLAILLCAIASFFMGIASAVAIGIIPQFIEFQRFKVVVIIWLVSSSLADIIITISLAQHLSRHKTGFVQTDTYVDRVIRLTVQTGLITAIWAFIDLMLYLLNPTGLHLIFNFPLSKLYTNSLMSSLNARAFWQNPSDDDALIASNRSDAIIRLSQLGIKPEDHKAACTESQRDTEVFVHVESHCTADPSIKSDRKVGSNVSETTVGLSHYEGRGLHLPV